MRYAPRWQLITPHHPARNAIRALAWLYSGKREDGLEIVKQRLPAEDSYDFTASRAVMPMWNVEPVGALIKDRGRATPTDAAETGKSVADIVDRNSSFGIDEHNLEAGQINLNVAHEFDQRCL